MSNQPNLVDAPSESLTPLAPASRSAYRELPKALSVGQLRQAARQLRAAGLSVRDVASTLRLHERAVTALLDGEA